MSRQLAVVLSFVVLVVASCCNGFMPQPQQNRPSWGLSAAPKRWEDNVEGVLYVNEKVSEAVACFFFMQRLPWRKRLTYYHCLLAFLLD